MQRLAIAFAACALLTLGGCGADTHDGLMTELLDQVGEMNNTLDTVKDKESAEAAKPKVESIAKEIEAIKKRMDTLEEPPADVQAELKAKYEAQIQTKLLRMVANVYRVRANPETAAVLEPALKNIVLN